MCHLISNIILNGYGYDSFTRSVLFFNWKILDSAAKSDLVCSGSSIFLTNYSAAFHVYHMVRAFRRWVYMKISTNRIQIWALDLEARSTKLQILNFKFHSDARCPSPTRRYNLATNMPCKLEFICCISNSLMLYAIYVESGI